MSGGSRALGSWLIQRFSAVYLAAFVIYFLVSVAVCPPDSFAGWHGWITGSVMNVATALFFLALVAHAWVGIRDVVLDYVHVAAMRVVLLALIGGGLLACLLWAGRVLWTS